jgi:hypothetical protein
MSVIYTIGSVYQLENAIEELSSQKIKEFSFSTPVKNVKTLDGKMSGAYDFYIITGKGGGQYTPFRVMRDGVYAKGRITKKKIITKTELLSYLKPRYKGSKINVRK